VSVTSTDREVSSLLAERERILDSLEELDFDNSMGKIPEENYPTQRARLVQQGALVLQQLDTYQQADAGLQTDMQTQDEISDELEAMIAKRKKGGSKKSGAFCHNCGRQIEPSDHFCANCGVDLT
jgi:5-methylcytosine-specific restriction endonuclease McrA